MDSESKALRWVANLRDHFNALRSEADVIIPQEPIDFVRNQFQSLKKFCSELLEESLGCLEDKNLTLRPKENGDCVGMVEAEASEPSKTTEGVKSDAEEHVAPKACKISDDEVTSSADTCGFSEGEDAKDSYVSEPSGGIWLTQNPTGWQELDGSDDEFCTDFNMELNLLSYSKANNHLRRTASFQEWDEDLCDSDWEII